MTRKESEVRVTAILREAEIAESDADESLLAFLALDSGRRPTVEGASVDRVKDQMRSQMTTMNRPRFGRVARSFAIAAVAAMVLFATAFAASPAIRSAVSGWFGTTTVKRWTMVKVPHLHRFGSLNGVTAVSPSDAWAVGSKGSGSLMEHWNGKRWQVVPSPRPATTSRGFSQLVSVSAVSANDLWAVGSAGNACSVQPFIVHFNGTRWSVVPSARMPAGVGGLSSVLTLSPSDIWAVGGYTPGGSTCGIAPLPGSHVPIPQSLVEHWNGQHWKRIPSPRTGGASTSLSAVSGTSPTNVWAVGSASARHNYNRPLIEHWDGIHWTMSDLGRQGFSYGRLNGVTSLNAHSVWAVGTHNAQAAHSKSWGSSNQHTLVEHWNGTRWSVVPSPNTTCHQNYLGSIAMRGGYGFAVGNTGYCRQHPIYGTLIERWNGSAWRIVPSANARSYGTYLASVTPVSQHHAWAVGGSERTGNATGHPIIERSR